MKKTSVKCTSSFPSSLARGDVLEVEGEVEDLISTETEQQMISIKLHLI
jgi:hypothetical protein